MALGGVVPFRFHEERIEMQNLTAKWPLRCIQHLFVQLFASLKLDIMNREFESLSTCYPWLYQRSVHFDVSTSKAGLERRISFQYKAMASSPLTWNWETVNICAMVKSRVLLKWVIPPLMTRYRNNGSSDPSTYGTLLASL